MDLGPLCDRIGKMGRGQADQGNKEAIEIFQPSPLMRIPVELIVYILSFLPTADRLRARVNRALYKLEEGEQYYVDHMAIASKDNEFLSDNTLVMALDGPRSKYIDGLRKLAKNVYIGWLSFECYERENRELIPYIKNLPTETLMVNIDSGTLDMESGRSSLVRFLIDSPERAESNKLLQLIGITYVNGRFHSARKDVEVYVLRATADEEDDYELPSDGLTPDRHFFILMGRMMVAVRKWTMMVTEDVEPFTQNDLMMERYNEDGTMPQGRSDLEFLFDSIADVRNDTADFKRLPVVYS